MPRIEIFSLGLIPTYVPFFFEPPQHCPLGYKKTRARECVDRGNRDRNHPTSCISPCSVAPCWLNLVEQTNVCERIFHNFNWGLSWQKPWWVYLYRYMKEAIDSRVFENLSHFLQMVQNVRGVGHAQSQPGDQVITFLIFNRKLLPGKKTQKVNKYNLVEKIRK